MTNTTKIENNKLSNQAYAIPNFLTIYVEV